MGETFNDGAAIGTIAGKVTTTNFDVLLSKSADKFEFVRAKHPSQGVALSQIDEIELIQGGENLAHCKVIGALDPEGRVMPLKNPLLPETAVFTAENSLIEQFFHLEKTKGGAYIGRLSKRDIPIFLDLNKLLTKHIAVLAKSGAGKSYTVGVLLEEIMEQNVPLLVIDPHGEYVTIREKNTSEKDLARMPSFSISAKAYKNVREYGNTTLNPAVKPIALPAQMSKEDLVHILPRLSANQLGVLYNALKLLKEVTFESLRRQLDLDESPSKWALIPLIEAIEQMGLFSSTPLAYHELIHDGCSIINLKGYNPDVQEIIVWKLCSDLFQLRKEGKIPPFFLVVEEAHNFCPERSFGETKSSKILRDIASEGRKFGLGLCVISQRPARIDKSVLSQCTTQIILKVTNPNDLKAITSSVEGISGSSESEIQALPIGSALITGVVDIPLFVTIRPRRSLHGGTAIDMLASSHEMPAGDERETFVEKLEEFETKNLLPIVGLPPNNPGQEKERRDILIHSGVLLPATMLVCKDQQGTFEILAELGEGRIVTTLHPLTARYLPRLDELRKTELHILQNAFALGSFTDEDLIKKLGMNLAIKEELNTLVRKGYLLKKKEEKMYHISQDYCWQGLRIYPAPAGIELVDAPSLTQVPSKVSVDNIHVNVSRFTDIVDLKQCFILLPKAPTEKEKHKAA